MHSESSRNSTGAASDPPPVELATDSGLGEWLRQVRETATPFTMILIEVDGLRLVDETPTGGAGDRLMSTVGECLRQRLRRRDLLARQRGAAFAVLLHQSSVRAGRAVAERLRAGVAELGVEAAVGCVTFERGGLVSGQKAMDAASRALAAAKRGGHGNVKISFLVETAGESLDSSSPAV